MKKAAALTAIVILGLASVARAQGGPPQPAPEHKRLGYFAGTWSVTGEAKASPMGPAGPMTLTETCELMDGGFALVCRSQGKGPMGPTKAHAIMTYDQDKKAYTYTAAESNMPVFTALGQVAGPKWTWTTESEMGGKMMTMRVTVVENGPKTYDFTMEMKVDKGEFMKVAEAKATRTTS